MSYWNVFDQILSRNSLISVPQRVLARMIYAVSYLTCSRNCIWRHREFEPACPVHLWILSLFSTSFFSCHITTEHWKHKLTDYRDNLISSTYMCLRRSLMKHRYAALCFLKTFMSHDCITRGILFRNKHSSEHVVIIKMEHVYQASEQNMYRIMWK